MLEWVSVMQCVEMHGGLHLRVVRSRVVHAFGGCRAVQREQWLLLDEGGHAVSMSVCALRLHRNEHAALPCRAVVANQSHVPVCRGRCVLCRA